MRRKFLSIALVLSMLFAFMPIMASAETSGNCGADGNNLSWTLDDNGVLTISGTGNMKDYGHPATSPFKNNSNIKSIIIENGVTTIGEEAFDGCYGLKSVTIPNSVTSIGEHAFSVCEGLTSVTIPNSVTTIGGGAFSCCYGLKSVTIPDSVTTIGRGAFTSCSNLKSVTIPNSVTSIDYGAFWSCGSLTSVTIPDSVISIGNYAFRDCRSLTSVTIPDSVTTIGENAFSSCLGLTSVIIPDSVISIGNYAFRECRSLTSVTIPDSVTSIGEYAFGDCGSLTSVTIPNNVTTIGEMAFNNCKGLTSINVDDSNPNYCSAEGNLFNKSKTTLIQYSIGKTANSYEIPDSVKSIGEFAFMYCSGLKSVTIPDSVISIGDGAFKYCSGLTDVYYSGTKAQWKAIFIGYGNNYLTGANIHFSLANITVVKSETADNKWQFSVTVEEVYADSVIYAAVYDDNGVMIAINQMPLTDLTTNLIVDKSNSDKYAKIFVWTDNVEPITKAETVEL